MESIAPRKRISKYSQQHFNVPHPLTWLVAITVVFLSGILYRVLVSHLDVSLNTPIVLPVPLNEIPIRIGDWTGQDVPLPEAILRIAGNDDYLYRIYKNEAGGHWVNVYISYSGRPRTMVGHRPEVCYGAAGWVHDATVRSEFQRAGLTTPCLIHRFHKPGFDGMDLVVLNYYILNGHISNTESGFTGVGWRTPNIAGNPAHYVAQVQISSVLESQVRAAAESMTDLICGYLPDEKGRVKAAAEQSNLTLTASGAAGFSTN